MSEGRQEDHDDLVEHAISTITEDPSKLPLIIGQLLDANCPDNVVQNVLVCTHEQTFSNTKELIEVAETRNRLEVLRPWLESRVWRGTLDPCVHRALAKICIDGNANPEEFLKRLTYPQKQLEAAEPEPKPQHHEFSPKRPVIHQVVQLALETRDSSEISEALEAFLADDAPHELIEFLEKIIFEKSTFSESRNLQNLLILSAIKADQNRLPGYITKLDNYDAPYIAKTAISNGLYGDAFTIFEKYDFVLFTSTDVIEILQDNMEGVDHAICFAEHCKDPRIWALLGKAYLQGGQLKDAIAAYIKAEDSSVHEDIFEVCLKTSCWEEFARYLEMARGNLTDIRLEEELVFCYAKLGNMDALESIVMDCSNIDIEKMQTWLEGDGMLDAAGLLGKLINEAEHGEMSENEKDESMIISIPPDEASKGEFGSSYHTVIPAHRMSKRREQSKSNSKKEPCCRIL